jgi:hypothetical protein
LGLPLISLVASNHKFTGICVARSDKLAISSAPINHHRCPKRGECHQKSWRLGTSPWLLAMIVI